MTIEEKILVTMEKRSNALNSLKGIRQAKVDLEDEQTFNNRYLFGDSSPDPGLIDIFISYYRQANFLDGRTTLSPAMIVENSYSLWTDRMELCVRSTGDGADGIYPPTVEGFGQDTINTSSPWFTTNDPSSSGSGLVIPVLAPLASAGQAIITRRDELSGVDPFPPLHEDYFNDPERATLLAAFLTVIAQLNAVKPHIQATIDILNEANTTGIVFSELQDMRDDLPMSDIATMDALLVSIDLWIADYQAQHDYFIAYPASDDISGEPGYNQATFNTNLTTTITTANSTTSGALTSRSTAIPPILGTTSYPYSEMRKWRYFWMSENVSKPQSPYVSLGGIATAISQSENGLNQANIGMSVFAPDPSEYFKTPDMVTAYLDNPVFTEGTSILEEGDAHLIWIGDPSANKYKIYRKAVGDVLLNNDNWAEIDLLVWQNLPADEGMVYMEYIDTTVVLNNGYVYRMQIHDTNLGTAGQPRIDTFDSSSLQSPILNLSSTVTIDLVTEVFDEEPVPSVIALQLTLSEELILSAGVYLALLSGTRQGLYRVLEVNGVLVNIEEVVITSILGSTVSPVGGSRFLNY